MVRNLDIFSFQRYHWFNMVTVSPWPLLLSINALPFVLGLVAFMHGFEYGLELALFSFITFLLLLGLWFRDIYRESTIMGLHTLQVDKNTITGFKLFLFTETMLFVTFFWSHLYSALFPSVFIGLTWPPVGMEALLIDPYGIPLINTIILVYSGFTITLSHLYLRRGARIYSCLVMGFTIILGFCFLYFQYDEFTKSLFDISDGIYGSTFFMLTGFHGGHVIIGVSFLIITAFRIFDNHFTSSSHTGFKLGLIYWHFVDVIWIFVYFIIYVLGSDFTAPNIISFNYCQLVYGHEEKLMGINILEDAWFESSTPIWTENAILWDKWSHVKAINIGNKTIIYINYLNNKFSEEGIRLLENFLGFSSSKFITSIEKTEQFCIAANNILEKVYNWDSELIFENTKFNNIDYNKINNNMKLVYINEVLPSLNCLNNNSITALENWWSWEIYSHKVHNTIFLSAI